MVPSASRTEGPTLDRRRKPHIWSWFLKFLECCSLPSLAVKLLGLLVEWGALLDNCETLDVQSLAGLLDCCSPRAKNGLGLGADLLAHNLASLVLLEGSGGVPSLGLTDLAGKDVTPCELGRDWLLLHRLHCLHGSHRLHCLHSFGHFRKNGDGDQGRIKSVPLDPPCTLR